MRWILIALLGLAASGCGDNKSPAAPTPRPPADIAGLWQGTLESGNFNAAPVLIRFSQVSATITGTWATDPASWDGTITGTVDATNFVGTFTISAPRVGGGVCTGTASFAGPAASISPVLIWNSPGFSGTCGTMPTNVVLRVQRR